MAAVAVYEALPVERDGRSLVDAAGRRWAVEREALLAGNDRRERVGAATASGWRSGRGTPTPRS